MDERVCEVAAVSMDRKMLKPSPNRLGTLARQFSKIHEPIHGNKLLIHSRYETECVCVCLFSWLLFSRLVPTIFHDFCIAFFSTSQYVPRAHTLFAARHR